MRRLLVASICAGSVAAAAGCSDSSPVAVQAPGVFVLARVEGQSGEPAVTWDHYCWADGRDSTSGVVRVQETVRDTVTLLADGTARRASVLQVLNDGVPDASPDGGSHIVATGSWLPYEDADLHYYYKDAPSIELRLTMSTPNGPYSYRMHLRWNAPDSLGTLIGVGGSCLGPDEQPDGRPKSDGHTAEYVFTRR